MKSLTVLILCLLWSRQMLGQSVALVRAAADGDIAAARSLLANGANPDEADNSSVKGWTALMAAAKAGSADIAQVLLDASANVNATNEYGATALDVAVANHGKSSPVATVIEKAGGKGRKPDPKPAPVLSTDKGYHGPGSVYRIGGGVSQPVPIYRPDPDYSVEARAAHLEGTVVLTIVVDEKGNARDVRVVKPLGMGLDEKAIEAVQKWRFHPGMKDGHPVKVMAQIEIRFRLLDDPPKPDSTATPPPPKSGTSDSASPGR